MSRFSPHRQRRFRLSLVPALAMAVAIGTVGCRQPEPSRPDVLVVLIDTLRADHLGAYGYAKPTSPTIDRIAGESVVFDSAYSGSTWTKPAVASLFTALHPSEHGIVKQLREDNPAVLRQNLSSALPTLAERFRAGGYRTVAIVRQPNLPRQLGFARGFDLFENSARGDAFGLVDRLLLDLDTAASDVPQFSYLHLLDVHWPYEEQLADRPLDAFGPVDESEIAWRDRSAIRRSRRSGFAGIVWPTMVARYDHGIAWTDAALDRLVRGIDARERPRPLWLVLVSDHGEGFLEHGRFEHNYEPYDEVARIPMVIRPPGGAGIAPGRRASTVSLTDLGPTLLELAGLPAWENVSGRSFAAIVRGVEEPARTAYIQMQEANGIAETDRKLFVDNRQQIFHFDRRLDPRELVNLAATGCVDDCRAALARMRAIESALRPAPAEDGTDPLTAEQIEELRALDYL